jgi:hypothetical protein
MNYVALFREYLVWHYSRALQDIIGIILNYLWFVNHLFSVPDVLKTLFVPWKRMQEKKVRILIDPGAFFGNILVNIIMRIVGFVVRSVLLFMATCGFVFIALFGICFFALWITLPLVLIHILLISVSFLFFP